LKKAALPPRRDWSAAWIIFLGCALRAYAAVSHLDISHPDEHFQSLEPASRVVFGYGWLSWEWHAGLRSWFVPGLYLPVLYAFKLLGFRGGPAPIIACRLLMAAATALALVRFRKLCADGALKKGSSLLALALFAFSPALAAAGAMTLSDV
jgi:hypothetical protein